MKEREDERRLDERRETCFSATFAEFAIVRSSTMVLEIVVEMIRCQCICSKRLQPYTSSNAKSSDA